MLWILLGTMFFVLIFGGLYLRKKKPEDRKKFTYWINSWGLAIAGICLTFINVAIYFLDKTQFEFSQFFAGVGMLLVGFYYVRKYKDKQ